MDAFSELMGPTDATDRYHGVAFAVVTNNKDPDGLGRVKVAFPWLDAAVESAWARVVTPMAGRQRGLYFLPEVDDEVLVAFEHGSPNAPYVLGGLWNGKDKPPESNADGKNNLRAIRSRSGHVVRFVDTAGEERIEIVDAGGADSIVISKKDNSITVKARSAVTVESGGAVTVKANGDITIEARGKLVLKGATVDIN